MFFLVDKGHGHEEFGWLELLAFFMLFGGVMMFARGKAEEKLNVEYTEAVDTELEMSTQK
jgi:hypothetical protein